MGWLALTGITALVLSTAMHRQEIRHSPEGIAHALIGAHWDVASYESETRRLSLQWEHDAEQRRQGAQERAAEHGRQLAQLRVDELDARRKAIEAQRAQADPYADRFRVQWDTEPAQNAIDGLGRTEAALQVQSIDDASTDDSSASWQAALVSWVASLYDAGAITEGGIIKGRVPWAARSSWLEADKREALRVCVTLRPALIEQADGGRWRLRREVFTDVDQVLQVLSPRLS